MASSSLLGEAFANAERYCTINNEGIRLRVSADRRLTIGLEYLNVDRHSDRHHAEFWLVTLVRIARALTGTRIAPDQVKLRHHRPSVPGELRRNFRSVIKYSAERDEVCFPIAAAELSVDDADTHLNKLLLEYANKALAERKVKRHSVRSQIEEHILRLLPHGKATVSEVARSLGMSSRTLSRTLSNESTGFSAILAELRQALAKRYLQEQSLPISEIAWLLGYREASSFTHAFISWTGHAPREFRSLESRAASRHGVKSQVVVSNSQD